MRYSPLLVQPMRDELTSSGFQELRSAAEVDDFMEASDDGALLIVNSVCGCAAGQARPGARLALASDRAPKNLATVFAGQDVEATARARGYFADVPPSSPSMAIFKGGDLVYFIPRHRIESRSAEEVAADLSSAFDRYFGDPDIGDPSEEAAGG